MDWSHAAVALLSGLGSFVGTITYWRIKWGAFQDRSRAAEVKRRQADESEVMRLRHADQDHQDLRWQTLNDRILGQLQGTQRQLELAQEGLDDLRLALIAERAKNSMLEQRNGVVEAENKHLHAELTRVELLRVTNGVESEQNERQAGS